MDGGLTNLMFGVADPFAGVTRAGIWLTFRGFLSDPRVLS